MNDASPPQPPQPPEPPPPRSPSASGELAAGDTRVQAVDVVVIGAGPAGEVAAGRCAEHGLSVVVVERELVGGECSYWGCIPSKALLRPGDVIAAPRRVPGAEAAVSGAPDVNGALVWRDDLTGGWDDAGQVPWLTSHGIDLVRGHARLDGDRRVVVAMAGGTTRTLVARRAVVVATGSRAALPPVPGLADSKPWDNRDVTAMAKVPRRLLVVGGGAVGPEMAQAVKRLGAESVSVIEAAGSLLVREEPFAGEQVRAALEAEGIVVAVSTRLRSESRAALDGPATLQAENGRSFTGDEVLVAASRAPPPAISAWTRSGSLQGASSRSTISCGRPASAATGCTPSATATASRCSRTWASTRRGSPPT